MQSASRLLLVRLLWQRRQRAARGGVAGRERQGLQLVRRCGRVPQALQQRLQLAADRQQLLAVSHEVSGRGLEGTSRGLGLGCR